MEFIDFKRAVYKQFDALANNADRLYLTNVNKDELWDCYIDSYPEDERQSHTCNCCRQFIKPYGNVVAIVNNKLVSIWDSLVLDEPYATVARNLAQLDPIAINLNKRLKESQTESFIKIRTKDTTELELKFNIVKHIIDVKLQEQEERIVAAEKKAKRQKILDLMAKKQDAELESKSYEELDKELEL